MQTLKLLYIMDMNKDIRALAQKIIDNIATVFVAKETQIRMMLIGFISGLHVLIEDIPGVGKTTLARCLASSIDLDFGRIQFTPDLMPGDVVGMTIWNQEKREFIYKPGAVMHQFILADEINRASPRTQSSLLEAMEEGAVTVDGVTHSLPEPFFVIATQNPVYFIGAFPLPEAQLDRFGISFSLGYPGGEDETEILTRFQVSNPFVSLKPVCSPEDITALRRTVREIYVDGKIKNFIIGLAGETRRNPKIKLGLSPRASQHLMLAAQTGSLLNGRDYVIPEDVLDMCQPVFAHRLVLSAEALMENRNSHQVVESIKSRIPIPTGIKSKRGND
jgi:MoxR-like ATPase